MKKTLLAVAIGTITAGISSQANAGYPTVYGRINLSVQQYEFDSISFPTTGVNKDPTFTSNRGRWSMIPTSGLWKVRHRVSA